MLLVISIPDRRQRVCTDRSQRYDADDIETLIGEGVLALFLSYA